MNMTHVPGNYTDLVGVMQYANTASEGWLGILIMVFAFIITLAGTSTFAQKNSLPATMFVMVVVSSILAVLGLLQGIWVTLTVFALMFSLVWAWMSDS